MAHTSTNRAFIFVGLFANLDNFVSKVQQERIAFSCIQRSAFILNLRNYNHKYLQCLRNNKLKQNQIFTLLTARERKIRGGYQVREKLRGKIATFTFTSSPMFLGFI